MHGYVQMDGALPACDAAVRRILRALNEAL